ncbi:uncharacterized protein [Henckelia pumila]|uniref:uncharacterized protein n=1 Tax=Henckelia pumila TaxID=405737 RepID=UPI003C6DF893
MRATVLKAPPGDLLACMEMAKIADLIAFVASPNAFSEESDSGFLIDPFVSQCLSAFRTLGLPSTMVLIRDLPDDLKGENELKKMCMSELASEFPEDCKCYSADKKDELHKILEKEQRLKVPHWRNQRPYLVAQKVDLVANDCSSKHCTIVLTGYLRARGLSINQLVHVTGAGDFQLHKIELLKDPCTLNVQKGGDLMDSEGVNDVQVVRSLTPDPMKQEPLVVENIPDLLAGKQTWPTEAEMAEADKYEEEIRVK